MKKIDQEIAHTQKKLAIKNSDQALCVLLQANGGFFVIRYIHMVFV